MPKIETRWQLFEDLSTDQLYELLRFRQNIFVVEQRSPYPDLDGLDGSAWHLAARADTELAGYLRLLGGSGPAPVGIGRVAVAAHQRRRGVGRILMEQALLFCRERFPLHPIALRAQLRLVPFYQSFGFAAVADPYDDFGVTHVEMIFRSGA